VQLYLQSPSAKCRRLKSTSEWLMDASTKLAEATADAQHSGGTIPYLSTALPITAFPNLWS
jgi:hypothetical protein